MKRTTLFLLVLMLVVPVWSNAEEVKNPCKPFSEFVSAAFRLDNGLGDYVKNPQNKFDDIVIARNLIEQSFGNKEAAECIQYWVAVSDEPGGTIISRLYNAMVLHKIATK